MELDLKLHDPIAWRISSCFGQHTRTPVRPILAPSYPACWTCRHDGKPWLCADQIVRTQHAMRLATRQRVERAQMHGSCTSSSLLWAPWSGTVVCRWRPLVGNPISHGPDSHSALISDLPICIFSSLHPPTDSHQSHLSQQTSLIRFGLFRISLSINLESFSFSLRASLLHHHEVPTGRRFVGFGLGCRCRAPVPLG